MKVLIITALFLIGMAHLADGQCGCGCCCCCDCVYTISTLPPPTTTTTTAGANPIPAVNSRLSSKKITMEDYKRIQDIIDNTIKSRARRYNYDLSAQLALDSPHYRHGDRDELLDDEDETNRRILKTTTSRSTVSIIGAVNPQKLEGAEYIPAPHHNENFKPENKDHPEHEEEPVPEEAPEFHRTKFQ